MGTHDAAVLDESAKKRNKKSKMKKTLIEVHIPTIDNDIAHDEQENVGEDVALEASAEKKRKKKTKKKRKEPEPDAQPTKDIAHDNVEDADGTQIDDDNEPTMADKLANLYIGKIEDSEIVEMEDPRPLQPPSADSVHVLLKQALHADDRALLRDCLYNQDGKVIANSVSLLNPSDIFKLLDLLISIIQSRGAVLVCALPWLRSLLLQHSSRIMSQESSLVALNSLYQLIESRVATLRPAVQLASSLDILFAGVDDDGVDECESAPPVIYEDNDESEEEHSGDDDMDTDQEEFSGLSDVSESDVASD